MSTLVSQKTEDDIQGLLRTEFSGLCDKHDLYAIQNAGPSVGVKGICTNCERVRDCKLPKAPTGVWHCEEYE
jgi:hypothetical protein